MAFDGDTLIGKTLGEYHLDRIVGAGNSGIVYEGHVPDRPGHQVAIKVLIPPGHLTAQEQETFRARFLREAAILTRLQHPHILPIQAVAVDEPSGLAYLVMPYLTGGTLADLLKGGSLPLAEVRDNISQLADALDYVHSMDVIHGDIRPANVLLDDQQRLYLADCGIARLLGANITAMTDLHQAIGALDYQAPEQIGYELVTPATDVYGLGMLAYQMVAGRQPFASSSVLSLIRQLALEDPPSPREFRPDLPPQAATAILRALAKRPEGRFPSAGAFALAFTRGLQGYNFAPSPQELATLDPATATGPVPDGAPLSLGLRPARANRRIPVLIGLPLATLVAITSLLVSLYGKSPVIPLTADTSSISATMAAHLTATRNPTTGNGGGGSSPATTAPGTRTHTPTQAPGGAPTTGPGTPTMLAPAPTATATPIPPVLAVSPSTQVSGCFDDGGGFADITIANQGGGTMNWSFTHLPSGAVADQPSGSITGNQPASVSLSNIVIAGTVTVTAPGAVGSPASVKITCARPPRPTPCPPPPGICGADIVEPAQP
jgi:serine/threonine protein kinase